VSNCNLSVAGSSGAFRSSRLGAVMMFDTAVRCGAVSSGLPRPGDEFVEKDSTLQADVEDPGQAVVRNSWVRDRSASCLLPWGQ